MDERFGTRNFIYLIRRCLIFMKSPHERQEWPNFASLLNWGNFPKNHFPPDGDNNMVKEDDDAQSTRDMLAQIGSQQLRIRLCLLVKYF